MRALAHQQIAQALVQLGVARARARARSGTRARLRRCGPPPRSVLAALDVLGEALLARGARREQQHASRPGGSRTAAGRCGARRERLLTLELRELAAGGLRLGEGARGERGLEHLAGARLVARLAERDCRADSGSTANRGASRPPARRPSPLAGVLAALQIDPAQCVEHVGRRIEALRRVREREGGVEILPLLRRAARRDRCERPRARDPGARPRAVAPRRRPRRRWRATSWAAR